MIIYECRRPLKLSAKANLDETHKGITWVVVLKKRTPQCVQSQTNVSSKSTP